VLVLRHLTMRYWSQRRTAAPLKAIPTETAVKRVSVLDRPGRREAASRHQAADFWIRPFRAKRTASSSSAVVKRSPWSCK
jgi:hypothetical protein